MQRGKNMRTKLQKLMTITLLAGCALFLPAAARADAVSDWNAIAVQAVINAGTAGTAGRPVPTGVLDLAMVHAAIYDAVQAIEKRYEPYYVDMPGATGSPVAAAAKAAHGVLVSRFPSQAAALDLTYQQYLMTRGIPDTDSGIAVGARAAAGIIALRSCDLSFPNPAPPPFIGGTGIGVWRPTPPANASMTAPWLANVTPFFLTRPSQNRAEPPPSLTSREYARDYNEVKELGALNGSSRTPEQTDIAHFHAGNPFIYWNRALRDISDANVSDIAESSRLFALADMAVADATITVWNDKIHYAFWRPITAINQGDDDDNPKTAGDPTWQPLYATPPYPDYGSGANGVSGAFTRSLEHFFGTDRMAFSLTTTNTGPTINDTRNYTRFSDAADDMEVGRIYMGIHFRFADRAGRRAGENAANFGFRNYLRPVTGPPSAAGAGRF